jgi:uncharacterized protein YheU (UPF0270 family)
MNTEHPAASPDEQAPVEIPHSALSPEALRGVIESFVLREGTDYGEHEFSLEQKVAQITAQLARREVCVLFDPLTESVTISLTQKRR